MNNDVARCKRSFTVYCKHVHGVSDKIILLETFEVLKRKYETILDFHVAIIEAYQQHLQINGK